MRIPENLRDGNGRTRAQRPTAPNEPGTPNVAPSVPALTLPPLSDGISALDAALAYAKAGWYVGPVQAGTKHPGSILGEGWQGKTTRNPDQIRAWYEANPDAGVFLHVGRSGALVFDVDHPELMPERLWRAIERDRPPHQRTRRDQDGRGDYLYALPPGRTFGNSPGDLGTRWGEVRGTNGVSVLAPSTPPALDGCYSWATTGPLSTLPAELVEALTPATRKSSEPVGEAGQHAALVRELMALLQTKEGERNQRLNSAAYNLGQLTGPGGLDEDTVRAALTEAGQQINLDPQEVAATVESGLRSGRGNPRPVSSEDGLKLTAASQIQIEPVFWLWQNRLALGTLSLLAGREGLGKSTLAYWLAAQVTLGRLPGEFLGTPRSVLVCATEDSWAHTIVPRLTAAGADLDQVWKVDAVEHGFEVGLSLPKHTEQVQEIAVSTDSALLLLDPLMSRLDAKLDTHKDAEVRRALEPLSALARDGRLSVLGLMHHNKSGSSDLSNSVMGSRAFSAVARSVCSVIPDPDDESGRRRIFGTWKNNLGPDDLASLAFTIEGFEIPGDPAVRTSRIVWGDELAVGIQEVQRRAEQRAKPKSAVERAAEWLVGFLEEQPGQRCDSDRIKRAALGQGIPETTLKVAKGRAGVLHTRAGVGRSGGEWHLPDAEVQEALS